MTVVADDLRAARKLIENPSRWGQGLSYERRRPGTFCAQEAIDAATSDDDHGNRPYVAMEIMQRLCGGPLTRWNDDPQRTHAEVLDLFDRAIAKAEETS